ncbi:MAG: response regulator transcription factor [Desulfobacteraceae bacterium]|nr:response regulator transcription factor [Desulfobacteraceae bacterium]
MSRLLMIDDDVEFCESLKDYLEPEGFEVSLIHDGKEGLQELLSGIAKYDLIVLDIMLPGMNGFEVLQRIRARLSTPVLMVTGRDQEVDRIVALEIGADDFLAKPCNPRELVARIRAILRRTQNKPVNGMTLPEPERIVLADIELDRGSRTAHRNGERLPLTSAEFNFLDMLLRSAGRVVTREQLAERILGRMYTAYDRALDVHVSNLRRKLGHEFNGIERIKTVRSVGYVYAIPFQISDQQRMHMSAGG